MPASKIVNEQEVLRWFEEGRSYQWMVAEYKRKYDIDTVPSMWGNFRRRRGLQRRTHRDDDLLPWGMKDEHRWLFPAQMLRAEARRRAGKQLRPHDEKRLANFVDRLRRDGLVVHYDPDTKEGFFYVPAREGIDTDLIRKPDRKTSPRLRAD
ncbi:hypothetical protein [Micromonospora sp. HM5-17]|jgi:hypothetical protein|uniref:hypothetical protein n=1 Tax=Micromonospora sp. HM5-17 TaxID=2487710 RepID=UPI000F4A4CC0|nr:hypothetical protein [Micromonospora sp. HM5-17]ROT25863.1 hypothetical protein EF879_26315 [Micromonospora sp. HM5-17]